MLLVSNQCIFESSEPVMEEDFEDALKIGQEMIKYAEKHDLYGVTASMFGINKQIISILSDDGFEIYFNPIVKELSEQIDDGSGIVFDVGSGERYLLPVKLINFPENKYVIECVPRVSVDAYSVCEDDRINFNADNTLSEVWQVMDHCLKGVDKENLIERDCQTIRNEHKKLKPNDKCENCGKKIKKCNCEIEEEEI